MSPAYPHPSDSRVQQEIEVATVSCLEREHPDWERAEWKASADLNFPLPGEEPSRTPSGLCERGTESK